MAKKDEVRREVPEEWKGPTQITKSVERPDRTADEAEADERRKAWEKAHKEGR